MCGVGSPRTELSRPLPRPMRHGTHPRSESKRGRIFDRKTVPKVGVRGESVPSWNKLVPPWNRKKHAWRVNVIDLDILDDSQDIKNGMQNLMLKKK